MPIELHICRWLAILVPGTADAHPIHPTTHKEFTLNREPGIEIQALGDALASTLAPEAQQYWRENADRIAQNLLTVRALCASHRVRRVLDIGTSYQTVILKQICPELVVETMGWEDHRYRPAPDTVHHTLDLNQTATPDACVLPPPVDMILFLEVIEHLHTSPRHVLRYLFRCLNPGGLLVISTPNAAFLRNRLQLLIGANPFERIREDAMNPGHFREYTRTELVNYCNECGFIVIDTRIDNLFRYGAASWRWFSRLTQWLPQNFRRDMTVVAQKPVG